MAEKGGISVQTEHIFPVIKKWLYSDKDIFLRELVSNATDAIMKLIHLSAIGEAKNIDDNYSIWVVIDKEKKTLSVSDNGIGMTEDEVKKYINQIALSGALDFIQKYDSDAEDAKGPDGIIGHFGLGFYSSFMVAERVNISTKSYTDAPAVFWTCTDDGEYEMVQGDRTSRGTEITMCVSESELEYLEKSKIAEILGKYCSFMQFPIYLEVVGEELPKHKETDAQGNEIEVMDERKPINDTEPLWQKNPSQCTDEEYKEFYKKVFYDWNDPLFYIHINADYPLNFKGILYFPRLKNEYESLEGQVKLFYNRVFVADNIKEVLPDYLLMLKGVLDCPELPLNVSRSYLQGSAYVEKIANHIVKKVCDKLNGLFSVDRENYEKCWSDIKTFVEYACIRDKKFFDKVKDSLIFKTTDGEYLSVAEYNEKANKDKTEKVIYYTNDPVQQAVYVNLFKARGIPTVVLEHVMDSQFITSIEQGFENTKFTRVDADASALKGEGDADKNEALEKLFIEASGNDKMKVEISPLADEKIPALLNISEQSRRFEEMMHLYRLSGEDVSAYSMPQEATLILNSNSALIKKLSSADEDLAKQLSKHIYTLALLGQRKLSAAELSEFVETSGKLMEKLL
ncbi:MAG: molecular chaperone HtpG [Clostridia bacterium]|nr:molecular chaperone HtpG [Clostridia bacterium]